MSRDHMYVGNASYPDDQQRILKIYFVVKPDRRLLSTMYH